MAEKEKNQALNELKEAKKQADAAHEKFQEALVAQKRAEETSEIEKFRAVELEQAGIEAAQKKEEEWQKELEAVKSQHALDLAALLTATQELQRAQQELAMVTETKNQALSHADDATKIAEIQAEKVDFLSAELARLKGLLESKAEDEASENGIVAELKSELGSLRQELEKAKTSEQEFVEKEKSYEITVTELKSDLQSLKEELDKAKSIGHELVDKENLYLKAMTELKSELGSLEQELQKAKTSEQDLVEKEKSYKKILEELKSELSSKEEELEKAKNIEQELIEKEKAHEEIVTELHSKLHSLNEELQKAKGIEEKLIEKEASYEQTVKGLKSETDLLQQKLEEAKSHEEELLEREKSNKKMVAELEAELHSLEQDLVVARAFQEQLAQKEEAYEQLNVELEAARMAESYALNLLDEWKRRAEELEHKVAESNRLERSASESLESVMKQLEGNSDLLHEAECEITTLKEKLSLLEISLMKKKWDLEESERRLVKANEEAAEAAKMIELLRSELETVKEEKAQAVENEKLAASNVQELLEEKNKLINDLENLREEEEKSKKAMESLASALHEVSAEAREAKEKLLSSQAEHENFEIQIEHLQLVLKATNEKYEAMLDDSKREIDHLTNTVEQSKIEFDTQMEDLKVVLKASNEQYESMLDEAKQEVDHLTKMMEQSKLEHEKSKAEWAAKELELMNCVKRLEEENSSMEKEMKMIEQSQQIYQDSKAEWEQKELQLVNGLKRSEEEKSSMEKEIMRLVHLLGEAEEKAHAAQEEGSQLRSSLKEARSEVGSLKEALEEAETDCLKLKDNLRDKETELQNITRENEQLRAAEDSNLGRIGELTKLLEEAKTQQQAVENGELSDSDKDYDMLPKVVEFSEENGHVNGKPQQVERVDMELPTSMNNGLSKDASQLVVAMVGEVNGKPPTSDNEEKVKDETADSETKMWESYKVDRDFSTEMETEQGSLDDEVESKAEPGESLDQMNGLPSENSSNSDSKQQNKKKKPLYRKFGNLLKKGISPQK